MKFNPTDEQRDAINLPAPLMVCAAAGSGKTAVLANRAVNLIKNKSVSADRLLIVTFTNAAAAEMKQRIEKYMDEECAENPQNTKLLEQRLMLDCAKICTIDSFCIDFVRENAQLCGVEPDFKLLDNFALEELGATAMRNVFNRYYTAEDPDFLSLLDAFGADYGDSNVADAVKTVYGFSRNIPFPDKWLDRCAAMQTECGDINDSPYAEVAYSLVDKLAEHHLGCVLAAQDIVSEFPDISPKYVPVFAVMISALENIRECCAKKNWDGLFAVLNSYAPGNLPTIKDPQYASLKEAIKVVKSDVKKAVESAGKLIYDLKAPVLEQQNFQGRLVLSLIKAVRDYSNEVYKLMQEKNSYTFYNAEQMTLELLCDYVDGRYVPTEQAKELSQLYDEVMVDEYQDVNDLQNCIFDMLSANGRKLFAVGDVKQSIYGFRGSNPENFIRKLDSNKDRVVNMSGNFRSRDTVCEFVNDVFSEVYPAYTKTEYLDPRGKFAQNDDVGCEMYFSSGGNTAVEDDAESVARYILDVVNREPFISEKVGEEFRLRRANFGDIAVLLPTLGGATPKLPRYLEAFRKYSIPASCLGTDFSSAPEILTAVSLLQVADNPSIDTALLSVMLSPIGSFSADEAALIRSGNRKHSVYSSLVFAANNGNSKAKNFLNLISKLRNDALTLPLSAFVSRAFDTTDIYELVASYGEAEQRRSNLSVLCDMAVSFEKNSGSDLSAFIGYLNRVIENGMDSPASAGNRNSVKVMSLHSSKGLQFKVCILAGLSERFNNSHTRDAVSVDEKLGISLRFIDEEKREKFVSLSKLVMTRVKTAELFEEKMRLLYVGMTRAEDKLALFISRDYSKTSLSEAAARFSLLDRTAPPNQDNASSFSAILIPSLLGHPDAEELRERAEIYGYIAGKAKNVFAVSPLPDAIVEEQTEEEKAEADESICSALNDAFEYKYPYERLNNVSAKTSVSALVHERNDSYDFTLRPAFMAKFGLTPAQRGTALHRFMETADFSAAECDLDAEISRLLDLELLSEAAAESIDKEKVSAFFSSDIYKRIKKSLDVRREMRFVAEMDATVIDPSLPAEYEGEKILVQGAVDLLFEEDGELVIVDFKTDVNKTEEQLLADHSEQLRIYSAACEQVTGKKVREAVIYSLFLSKEVSN